MLKHLQCGEQKSAYMAWCALHLVWMFTPCYFSHNSLVNLNIFHWVSHARCQPNREQSFSWLRWVKQGRLLASRLLGITWSGEKFVQVLIDTWTVLLGKWGASCPRRQQQLRWQCGSERQRGLKCFVTGWWLTFGFLHSLAKTGEWHFSSFIPASKTLTNQVRDMIADTDSKATQRRCQVRYVVMITESLLLSYGAFVVVAKTSTLPTGRG